jgi:hypothetical protein
VTHCASCNNTGILENPRPITVDSRASFCYCAEGMRKRLTEPEWCDRVNAARVKLSERFKSKALKDKGLQALSNIVADEEYRGEF